MAQDKQLARIEAKLDALLEERGIKPEDVTPKAVPARSPRELTAAEQQAIDNAPKPTPIADAPRGPRVTQTGAPSTASSVPPGAVGSVTVETEQPSGKTTTETKPASAVKGKDN